MTVYSKNYTARASCSKRLHLHVALGCLVNKNKKPVQFQLICIDILNCNRQNTLQRESQRERKKHSRCLFPCHRKLRNPNFDRDRRDSRCKFGSARLNWRAACVAFILQPLFLSLSLTFLLSRAKRDLWNYCCCETFAAGFLFDDYIHVYVSEGCELNKGEDGVDRERAAQIFTACSQERMRAGVLRHSLVSGHSVLAVHKMIFYLSFYEFLSASGSLVSHKPQSGPWRLKLQICFIKVEDFFPQHFLFIYEWFVKSFLKLYKVEFEICEHSPILIQSLSMTFIC
jgi:hypothetical protein